MPQRLRESGGWFWRKRRACTLSTGSWSSEVGPVSSTEQDQFGKVPAEICEMPGGDMVLPPQEIARRELSARATPLVSPGEMQALPNEVDSMVCGASQPDCTESGRSKSA